MWVLGKAERPHPLVRQEEGCVRDCANVTMEESAQVLKSSVGWGVKRVTAACQRPGKRDHCEDVFFYLKKKAKDDRGTVQRPVLFREGYLNH